MSTISNERLDSIERQFIEDGFNDITDSEVVKLVSEVRALRKEREAAVPVCPKCGNTGLADSGGVQPWGEPILIECDCTFPPAPGADDSLPYDPQIAEYEQMMEAELKAAARTAYKVKSELSQMAEKLVRDTTELAATLSAETDTTSQQFESLAGKAVSGWIPCSERMPEEMVDVLVTDGEEVKGMWWNGRGWDSWDDRYALDSDDVTHWQPLPEPPCK